MQLEDKELEGPELEREQRLEVLEDEYSDEKDRDLPELAGVEVVDAELEHRTHLFDALQLILAGENLNISLLYLPQRETHALEALQAAVTGRSADINTFVFAEDRGALLEQALAILQQNLTQGDSATLAALQTKYEQLTEHVAELRDRLLNLEDAQEELLEIEKERSRAHTPDETDEPADESVTGFIASALNALAAVAGTEGQALPSTLDGPEVADLPFLPSTLGGEDLVPPAKPPTLLGPEAGGPEAPLLPDHVSVLDGAEPTRPEFVSTLEGPDLPAAPARRSRLYTEGMSALLVPPEQRTVTSFSAESVTRGQGEEPAPSIQPPVRSSSPTIDPPRTSPPARKSSPSLQPLSEKPDEPSSHVPPKEPPRRGLSVRSTEKPDPKGKKK